MKHMSAQRWHTTSSSQTCHAANVPERSQGKLGDSAKTRSSIPESAKLEKSGAQKPNAEWYTWKHSSFAILPRERGGFLPVKCQLEKACTAQQLKANNLMIYIWRGPSPGIRRLQTEEGLRCSGQRHSTASSEGICIKNTSVKEARGRYLGDSLTQPGKIALFYKQLDCFHAALKLVLVALLHRINRTIHKWETEVRKNNTKRRSII
jgi:hypothetical protein